MKNPNFNKAEVKLFTDIYSSVPHKPRSPYPERAVLLKALKAEPTIYAKFVALKAPKYAENTCIKIALGEVRINKCLACGTYCSIGQPTDMPMFCCTSCSAGHESSQRKTVETRKNPKPKHDSSIDRRGKEPKYTHEEFSSLLSSTIQCISTFMGLTYCISLQCTVCTHTWSTRAGRALRRNWCPNCWKKSYTGPTNKKTHEEYVLSLSEVTTEIVPIESYIGAGKSIEHKHLNCGHIWRAMPSNLLKGRGCPRCKLRLKSVPKGHKTVLVQGYEDKALRILLKTYAPSKIHVAKEKILPRFRYKLRGSSRVYYPDMFIPKENTIIEVKYLSTVGLLGNYYYKKPSELYYEVRAKARAVISEGYSFKLMVIKESGELFELPEGWESLSYTEIRAFALASPELTKRDKARLRN